MIDLKKSIIKKINHHDQKKINHKKINQQPFTEDEVDRSLALEDIGASLVPSPFASRHEEGSSPVFQNEIVEAPSLNNFPKRAPKSSKVRLH